MWGGHFGPGFFYGFKVTKVKSHGLRLDIHTLTKPFQTTHTKPFALYTYKNSTHTHTHTLVPLVCTT